MDFRATSGMTRTILHVLAALSSLTLACSATAGGEPGNAPADNGTNESGGGGGNGGGGGDTDAGNDIIEFDAGGPSGTGGAGGYEACAKTGGKAEPVDLDLVILLDRSGSMYGQNWTGATSAIKEFVNDPASAGINVGILYFPVDMPPDGLVCNRDHYDDLAVPIGSLPQNAAAITLSIDNESPNGGSTPMYGALDGALLNTTAYKTQNPGHKVILVLASDGDPNSCTSGQNAITAIADLANSALNFNGVETYVIAIAGASVSNLNQIAAQGGTGQSYDVTGNISQFAQKMAEIRSKAIACELVIPAPPGNEPFELDKVSVKYTNAQGSENEIPHADSAADCGLSPGWYYDDPVNPKQIKLCPASCLIVQGDPQGTVDVIFGCKPKLN